MNDQLNRPKRFGEILDTAFQVVKRYFSPLFLMMLIVVGPLYLLKNILLALSGTNFLSEAESGDSWYTQFISAFDTEAETTAQEDMSDILVGVPDFILTSVVFVAVLCAIYQLKRNQEFTVGTMLKQAFSKFGRILGSSLLFFFIIVGMTVAAIIFVSIFALVGGGSDTSAIILIIILLLAAFLLMAYFLTRWSLFLGVAVMEGNAPGFGRSWHLTRGYAWKMIGIYLVFALIFLSINIGVDTILLPLMGESVLYYTITDLLSLLLNTILAVGYAIVYFDIKSRHDGDDLKDMIEEYESDNKL